MEEPFVAQSMLSGNKTRHGLAILFLSSSREIPLIKIPTDPPASCSSDFISKRSPREILKQTHRNLTQMLFHQCDMIWFVKIFLNLYKPTQVRLVAGE